MTPNYPTTGEAFPYAGTHRPSRIQPWSPQEHRIEGDNDNGAHDSTSHVAVSGLTFFAVSEANVTDPIQGLPSGFACLINKPYRSTDGTPSYCGFKSRSGAQDTHEPICPWPKSRGSLLKDMSNPPTKPATVESPYRSP